jgi:hypothetical protein
MGTEIQNGIILYYGSCQTTHEEWTVLVVIIVIYTKGLHIILYIYIFFYNSGALTAKMICIFTLQKTAFSPFCEASPKCVEQITKWATCCNLSQMTSMYITCQLPHTLDMLHYHLTWIKFNFYQMWRSVIHDLLSETTHPNYTLFPITTVNSPYKKVLNLSKKHFLPQKWYIFHL